MNYEKIYNEFYSKYYDKAEYLIKLFLIKSKSENLTFGYSLNEVRSYVIENYSKEKKFFENSNLIKLHAIFLQRHSIYEINQIQEIFANPILKAFRKIPVAELPKEYSYSKLIKDIALVEVKEEILRLLTNNSSLLHMFYQLNNFEEFEIRYYDNLLLEQYPIYKKMNLALNPAYFENLRKIEDLKFKQEETFGEEIKQEKSPLDVQERIAVLVQENCITFNSNEWNEACFKLFYYLIDNYTAKDGKTIKYINIWYFLKRGVNREIYTFSFTQEKYRVFIKENFGTDIKKFAKAEYDFDEQKSILNSLEVHFRRLMLK